MTALIISVKIKQRVWMLKQDTIVYVPQVIKENTAKKRLTCVITTHVKIMQVVYRLLMISYVRARMVGKGKFVLSVSEHIEPLCYNEVPLTLIVYNLSRDYQNVFFILHTCTSMIRFDQYGYNYISINTGLKGWEKFREISVLS